MPGIRVPIIGDAKSVLTAFEQTKVGAKSVGAEVNSVNLSVARSAALQGEAAVKSITRLRAQVVEYQRLGAAAKAGSTEQIAYTQLAAKAQSRLNVATGVTTATTAGFSKEARGAENELNKMIRGGVAGTGVFSRMGRSLAFASTAFIGFSLGGAAIGEAIRDAEGLDAALRSVDVTARKMHISVAGLTPEIARWGSEQQKLGVSTIDATRGFARELAFTHDVTKARQAYTAALEISRVTGRNLNQVEIATAKAATGQTTALARYIGTIKQGTTWQQEYNLLQRRFGGQALASTTTSEKFRASLTNLETELGTALLPTFDKAVSSMTAWTSKSQNQKAIVDDVTTAIHGLNDVLKLAAGAIHLVDKVTGSFGNTLEVVVGLKFAMMIAGAITKIRGLALAWGGVTAAAGEAAGAEALAGGAAGGGSRGGGPRIIPFGGPLTALAVGTAIGLNQVREGGRHNIIPFDDTNLRSKVQKVFMEAEAAGLKGGWQEFIKRPAVLTVQVRLFPQTGQILPRVFQIPGFGRASTGQAPLAPVLGPFGTAKPMTQYFKEFHLKFAELLAQAQAALTQGAADDLAEARREVARIKLLIDRGQLHNQALLQALSLEASALSTIQSAEQAIAQQRIDRLQAEKDQLDQHLQILQEQDARLAQKIAAIQDRYRQTVQSITQGIGQLFQGPVLAPTDTQRKTALGLPGPTAGRLTQDLKAQIAMYRRLNRDLGKLQREGAPKALIAELRGQGVTAIPEIEALTGANKRQREAFFKAYGARERLAQTTARHMLSAQLHMLSVDQAQLRVIRAQERQVTAGDKLIAGKIDKLTRAVTTGGVRTTRSGQTSGRNPGR